MKKIYQLLIATTFIILVTLSLNDVSAVVTPLGIACECGGSLYNSNATISIQTGNDLIPCGSVYSEIQENCVDRLLSYDIYNTYTCNKCSSIYPRDKVDEQVRYWCPSGNKFYNPITGQSATETNKCEHAQNSIYASNIAQHENEEIVPLGIVCECGGNLLSSNNLMLSDNYTVLSNITVKCKEYPDWENRRDEVWRYYFYNTYICNSCGEKYLRNKTSLYEDWGFCAHGGGKYPLNEAEPWNDEI